MTSAIAPLLFVVGVDAHGTEVVRLVLGHGDDPTALLAVHGWQVRRARDVVRHTVEKHVLTMSFVVKKSVVVERSVLVQRSLMVDPSLRAQGSSMVEEHPVTALGTGVLPSRDHSLVMSDGEVPEPYQRVAAYAFVTSSRGVLMTQFSDRTNAQGQWGLPGGGLEIDETPDRAVVREAWEESGQVIKVIDLALVDTSHWIGRAPTGRLEDFHAVRVLYRAVCPEPTEPIVHDIGGTTASAAWVQLADLDSLDLTPGWRALLSAVVVAPDEADGAQDDEHQANADDRSRS